MGNRVYKNSSAQGTRKYIVDVSGGLPTILLELDPNNGMEIKRCYVYANGEVLMKYEPYDRYFYVHDRLGSVRQVLKYARVMNSYTYGPFGEMIAADCKENTENPFKFTGQYYDSEIGQYYLRARQYDPVLMRFTGRDPVAGEFTEPMTLHAYLYCLNDPINNTDPSGEQLWGAIQYARRVVEAANVRTMLINTAINAVYHFDPADALGIVTAVGRLQPFLTNMIRSHPKTLRRRITIQPS